MVMTKPAHQGRGAGGMLIEYVCKIADANGEVAYVEASPSGLSTYRRFGFEEKDRVSVMINDEEYVNPCMVREPKKASK